MGSSSSLIDNPNWKKEGLTYQQAVKQRRDEQTRMNSPEGRVEQEQKDRDEQSKKQKKNSLLGGQDDSNPVKKSVLGVF